MNSVLEARNFHAFYGDKAGVVNVNIAIPVKQVTAIIGPSGCGKSTLLRSFNRMNDFIPNFRVEGQMTYRGMDLYSRKAAVTEIRKHIGMVFQKPNPFPMSIEKNILWGPKLHGKVADADEVVESALRRASLWDEVKDRLHDSALGLSGGQQQRLCIARAIAMKPEVILMDEPCSALDPRSTARIEDLINEMKSEYSIVIVTNNMQQAARVSDYTSFLYLGEVVEFGETKQIFTAPRQQRTEEYITGRFG